MTTLRVGDKIGKYELLHLIGEGGMGEVWVGRLRSLGGFESYVAVKVIHGRFAQEKRFRDMFLDEARVSALISHPNVVSTQDLAVEGEMLYQVMEYVDGDSLASLQSDMEERAERMPLPVALRIAAEVCNGLHAAHELATADGRPRGIVHRDVSPQNILLGSNGSVKLIDFGVALMQDRLAEDSQGSLKGKLRYMPQEQAKGEKVDRRADIYSLGAVLYEMVSGHLPFDDRTEALYFRALIQGDPPAPLPEDVPEDVVAVITKAMAVDREQRYPTADAMAEDLFAILRKRPANIASFVEIHMSSGARKRREVVRESSARGERSLDSNVATDLHPSGMRIDFAKENAPTAAEAAAARGPDVTRDVVLSMPSGPSSLGVSVAFEHGATAPSALGDPYAPHAPQGHRAPMPEIPSLELDRSPRRAPLAIPATAPSGFAPAAPGPRPGAGSSPHLRAEPASPSSLRAQPGSQSAIAAMPAAGSGSNPSMQAMPPAKHTTLMEPTPRGTQAITGMRDRHVEHLPEDDQKGKRALGRAVAFVGVFVFLIVAVLLALPFVAKRRIVKAAEERGITLEIEKASVGTAGIELSDMHATGPGLPLKTATIEYARISYGGHATFRGIDATLDGRLEDLPQALATLAKPGQSDLEVEATEVKLAWKEPLGKDTSFEAKDVRFGFETTSETPDVQRVTAFVPEFSVRTRLGKAGPFSINVDESELRKRVRLIFDPARVEGPSVFVVFGGATGPSHVNVRIPKSKLSTLHVPSAYFGLEPSDDPEIDLSSTLAIETNGKIHGDARANVSGLAFGGSRTKTPVDVELSLVGEPGKPLEITKGVGSYGPLTTDVTGTIARDPVTADVRFVSKPLPCSYFVGAEAKRALGVVGTLAVDLFGNAIRTTGVVNVRGTYAFDLRQPEKAKLKVDVRDTCGVSLFVP
jgi:serine/threonine-protein kinase